MINQKPACSPSRSMNQLIKLVYFNWRHEAQSVLVMLATLVAHLTKVCVPARAPSVHSGTSHRDVTRAPLLHATGRALRSSELANVVFQMCQSFLLEAAAGGFGWFKLVFLKIPRLLLLFFFFNSVGSLTCEKRAKERIYVTEKWDLTVLELRECRRLNLEQNICRSL